MPGMPIHLHTCRLTLGIDLHLRYSNTFLITSIRGIRIGAAREVCYCLTRSRQSHASFTGTHIKLRTVERQHLYLRDETQKRFIALLRVFENELLIGAECYDDVSLCAQASHYRIEVRPLVHGRLPEDVDRVRKRGDVGLDCQPIFVVPIN